MPRIARGRKSTNPTLKHSVRLADFSLQYGASPPTANNTRPTPETHAHAGGSRHSMHAPPHTPSSRLTSPKTARRPHARSHTQRPGPTALCSATDPGLVLAREPLRSTRSAWTPGHSRTRGRPPSRCGSGSPGCPGTRPRGPRPYALRRSADPRPGRPANRRTRTGPRRRAGAEPGLGCRCARPGSRLPQRRRQQRQCQRS